MYMYVAKSRIQATLIISAEKCSHWI